MSQDSFFQLIHIKPSCLTKNVVLNEIAMMLASQIDLDREYLLSQLRSREQLGGTTLTMGIATPHALIDAAIEPIISITVLDEPVNNWHDLNNQSVRTVILFVIPRRVEQTNPRINLLRTLFRSFADDSFLQTISGAQSEEQILIKIKQKLEES